jgi:hypothetical protein
MSGSGGNQIAEEITAKESQENELKATQEVTRKV